MLSWIDTDLLVHYLDLTVGAAQIAPEAIKEFSFLLWSTVLIIDCLNAVSKPASFVFFSLDGFVDLLKSFPLLNVLLGATETFDVPLLVFYLSSFVYFNQLLSGCLSFSIGLFLDITRWAMHRTTSTCQVRRLCYPRLTLCADLFYNLISFVVHRIECIIVNIFSQVAIHDIISLQLKLFCDIYDSLN